MQFSCTETYYLGDMLPVIPQAKCHDWYHVVTTSVRSFLECYDGKKLLGGKY